MPIFPDGRACGLGNLVTRDSRGQSIQAGYASTDAKFLEISPNDQYFKMERLLY